MVVRFHSNFDFVHVKSDLMLYGGGGKVNGLIDID